MNEKNAMLASIAENFGPGVSTIQFADDDGIKSTIDLDALRAAVDQAAPPVQDTKPLTDAAKNLTTLVKSARRVNTPLVAIQTADPAATIQTVCAAVNGNAPKIVWDVARGLVPVDGLDKEAKALANAAILNLVPPDMREQIAALTVNPGEAMSLIGGLPKGSIVFMCNSHRFVTSETGSEVVNQAIWNLRDVYKFDKRTLFLLAPAIKLPSELAQDVLVIDEDLPDDTGLTTIANAAYASYGLPKPDASLLDKIIPAMRGMAAFPAEQELTMCISKDGTDIAGLWARKKQKVEQTAGLAFAYGGPTLDEQGGQEQIKKLIDRLFKGKQPPRAVVFIDEVEKSMGGASGPVGDSSGTSQDQLGTQLKGFDELKATGILLVGPAGTGKSSFGKAVAATYGVPFLAADFGAAKGSLVGQTEANSRAIMKVIKAVGGEGVLFIVTSNRLEAVPPELQRRYGKYGTWMCDLPSPDERKAIWKIHLGKFGFDDTAELPDDREWCGSDIQACCEFAFKTGTSPRDAAEFISPVAKTSPEAVKRIRLSAIGKFRSANNPGYYQMPDEEA